MLHLFQRRWTKRMAIVAVVLAVLAGTYAVIGFIAAPRWLRSGLTSYVTAHYHRSLTLGAIDFNPFTLTLDVRNVSFPDGDGQPMLGVGRLHVRLEAATLWRLAPSFGEIVLERPFASVAVRRDGSVNLEDLAKPFASPATPQPKQPATSRPMRLFIERLAVIDGRVTYDDRSRATTFHTELRPVSLELRDFSTVGRAPDLYELAFATPLEERFRIDGTLAVAPLASRGHFDVAGLRARTLWSYARDLMLPEVAAGTIALEGDYELASGAESDLRIRLHRLTVSDLGLRSPPAAAKAASAAPSPPGTPGQSPAPARAGQADDVDLNRIELDDTRFDLGRRSLSVGAIRVAGGSIRAWLDPDGTLSLADWTGRAQPPEGQSNASAAGKATPARPDTAGGASTRSSAAPAWSVSAPDIDLSDLRIAAEDRRMTPAAAITLSGIHVHLAGLSTTGHPTLQLTADASVGRKGRLEAQGTYQLGTGAAHAQVRLSRIGLTPLEPYVARYTSIDLLSGGLGGKLEVDRSADGSLSATGETDVTKVRTIDRALHQDFVKWDRLSIEGIRYRSRPTSLDIRQITLRQPFARVIISPDRSLNVARALSPPNAHSGAPPRAATRAVATRAVATPEAATRAGATPSPAGASAAAFPISIRRIRIDDASARYADHWIEPNFFLAIEGLSGSVDGISSQRDSRAHFELNGKVDRFAPIRVSGTIRPFAPSQYTDLTMSFKGVELTTATPYSAHFAGYKIEKGNLSADITYHVVNRELTANHRFIIDQLQLGERVESPDAVKLPLKLAVALLKDRHGVIDLGLPVSGSLDDPKFRLGPLIWKAVVNLLAKAATAPFALLGKAFGHGPEIKEIDFDPGSDTLDAQARDRLGVIAKALAARPALGLDVPSGFAPRLDRSALAAEVLRRRLVALQRREFASRKRFSDTADESILANPSDHLRLLMAEYRAELGDSTPLPEAAQPFAPAARRHLVARRTAPPPAQSEPARIEAAIEALDGALLPHVQVSDADLEALAKRRARAIQGALLGTGGIDASRLFLLAAAATATDGSRVRVDLSLK